MSRLWRHGNNSPLRRGDTMSTRGFMIAYLAGCLVMASINVAGASTITPIFTSRFDEGHFVVIQDAREEIGLNSAGGLFPLTSLRLMSIAINPERSTGKPPLLLFAYALDLSMKSLPTGDLTLQPADLVPIGDPRMVPGEETLASVTLMNPLKSLHDDSAIWTCWAPNKNILIVNEEGSRLEPISRNGSVVLTKDKIFRWDYLANGMMAGLTDDNGHGYDLLVWNADGKQLLSRSADVGCSWGQLALLNNGRQVIVELLARDEKPGGVVVESYETTMVFDTATGECIALAENQGGFISLNDDRSRVLVLSEDRQELTLVGYSNPRQPEIYWSKKIVDRYPDAANATFADAALSGTGDMVVALTFFEGTLGTEYHLVIFDIGGAELASISTLGGRGLQIVDDRLIVYGAESQVPPFQPSITQTGIISIYEFER